MAYEIAITHRKSWIKRIVQFFRTQHELDEVKAQIRKERDALANLSDHELRDIGITRAQANREALRGYGDIPDSRRPFLICGC